MLQLINSSPVPVPATMARMAELAASGAGTTDEIVRKRGTMIGLDVGTPLFMEGDEARFLYQVVEGCVCSYKLSIDGRRQITGFHLPGDLLGVSVHDQHPYGAEPTMRSRIRRYSRNDIQSLLDSRRDCLSWLRAAAEGELASAQDQILLLGRKTVLERLVSFLLLMSCRAEKRGEAGNPVNLPMTRRDIADFLGLTTETVSRAFTQLRGAGLIALHGYYQVELRDIDALHDIADGGEGPRFDRSRRCA